MLRDARESLLKIGQMLPIENAAVAHNVDGKQAILEGRFECLKYKCLVDHRAHGNSVIARDKSQVGEGRGANECGCRSDIIVECDVALDSIVSGIDRKKKSHREALTIKIVITVGLGM